jgi:predicted dehydrogenase
MAKKKLNVAMIGYDFMGRAHSNAWRQVARFMPDLAYEPVMKVVAGRTEAKVKEAAERLGWEEYATRWEDVIARKDIDIIDICTPGDSHMPIALAAAEAKKHILCEKPLANTLADAEQMWKAATKAGVIHMVCHNYRRCPAVALAKQLIDAGHDRENLPLPRHLPAGLDRRSGVPARVAAGEVQRGLGLARRHPLAHDGSVALLVGEPVEVNGLLKTFISERPLPDDPAKKGTVDVDDAALSLVRYDNGAVGYLEGTRFATGRKNYNRFEINGAKGSIVWDLEHLNDLQLYVEEGANSGFRTISVTDAKHPYVGAWWPSGHIIGYEHSFTHTVYDFLRAIAEQKLPSPSFEMGTRTSACSMPSSGRL